MRTSVDLFVGTSCCCSSHHIVDLACLRSTFAASKLTVFAWRRTASTAVVTTVVASSSSIELTLESSTSTDPYFAVVAFVAFTTVGSTAAVAESEPIAIGSSSFSIKLKCTAFYCFQCERGSTCCITL